jgi:dipeptidase D
MRIEDLDPKPLWHCFARLAAIPHGSGNEAALRDMIIDLAQGSGLACRVDEAGNLLVVKPAGSTSPNRPPVVVQAHLDMVCEKNAGVTHDFGVDPIRLKIDDNRWVRAEGTTLGADNGIGVAAMMALMTDASLHHGPLELLFTVQEETGMHGARQLSKDWLSGRCLINLDAERDDKLIVGCAGSRGTTLDLPLQTRVARDDQAAAKITIAGLAGGHSGMDIHRGRANPIRLLGRLLRQIGREVDIDIAGLSGGLSLNALARRAEATVAYPVGSWHALKASVIAVGRIFQDEYAASDPGLSLEIQAIQRETGFQVFSAQTRELCLDLLAVLPHGVLAMDPADGRLVQTSTNLASVRVVEGRLKIGTKQRSLIDSQLFAAHETVAAAGRLSGCEVSASGAYPAWRPRPESRFVSLCVRTYETLFQRSPGVGAMHAGLECGLMAATFPQMEIVAIGPNIFDPHSPGERVEIASVAKFWRYLTAVLAAIQPDCNI